MDERPHVTELIARYAGSALFVLFAAYGLTGTVRLARSVTGPRPWALCALFLMLEAVQVYGLWIPRPDADVRGGAVVAIAALCFCGYLQYLYFTTVRKGQATFPRAPFYIGIVILLAIVLAAHVAEPYLP
jgi:hypothetical protein